VKKVYIRPLKEFDALTSFIWRNDPEVWKYTGSKPDRVVTEELELAWIRVALTDTTSKRFAICLSNTDEYIGNAQLTEIEENTANFHIFIGSKINWGNGYGTLATKLLLDYGITALGLQTIRLALNEENIPALKVYEKNGFHTIAKSKGIILMQYVNRGSCRPSTIDSGNIDFF